MTAAAAGGPDPRARADRRHLPSPRRRGEQTAPPVPGEPFGADNLHGRLRHTCTLVGECDLGCNEGAKNTLDYTYLTRFLHEGRPENEDAEPRSRIFTCCEATGLEPAPDGGYRVSFVEHRAARAEVRAASGAA